MQHIALSQHAPRHVMMSPVPPETSPMRRIALPRQRIALLWRGRLFQFAQHRCRWRLHQGIRMSLEQQHHHHHYHHKMHLQQLKPHAYQRQYGDPQFKALPTPQPPAQVDCIALAIHAAYCGVQHHIDEDCRAALDSARNDLIYSSLPETGVPNDVPVCLTPPCIQEGISGRVRLLEPVAVEIVACSDKEDDDSDKDDDAAAFWSDLEAHHADSQEPISG